MSDVSFGEQVRRATGGLDPYPFQCRIAMEGFPELLAVPTGTGKTLAAVLPWLYRRRYHADQTVRDATPRRLVFVLPMRVLAEQVVDVVRGWLTNLGVDDVECHLLLGGERLNSPWRHYPANEMIIVGTLDMIVSRTLNRGYGESRYVWPIDFGLFNADCQFVFDEVQLMGPALATSRQLHGLRQRVGGAIPCVSMWMSATVPDVQMQTVDAPMIGRRIELSDDDRAGHLAKRLNAEKLVERLNVPDPKRYAATIADHLVALHRPGTLSVAVLNTVDRARQVHAHLNKSGTEAEIILLHSRFRPADRKRVADAALSNVEAGGPGRIVVSTQVLEAGVDISARVLLTEAAPWPSIVQRAGRCNRDGEVDDPRFVWFEPPRPEPYEGEDVAASIKALTALTGESVTSDTLRSIAVAVLEAIHPVLRRKDLVELFDTLPDLSGNDIDVSRFIRKSDDLDLAVAWRRLPVDGPAADEPAPGRKERCPVPVGEFRKLLKDGTLGAWRYDQLATRWVSCAAADVRPGIVVLLAADSGCYDKDRGWGSDIKGAVEPIDDGTSFDDESIGDDPVSFASTGWVTLRQHLTDTERAAERLVTSLRPTGLSLNMCQAMVDAARLHDIGKAHEVFQRSLRGTARDLDPAPLPERDIILAKSGGTGRMHHERKYFRHELASALMLLGEGKVALGAVAEPDLVVYLVAAHHGRIRVGIRSLGDEATAKPSTVLGIQQGDPIPALVLNRTEIPATTLDLSVMELGERNGVRSWTARALGLRDRSDIGVFRLGFMEAVVRLADWEASASPALTEDEPDV